MKKILLTLTLAALVLATTACNSKPDIEQLDPFATSENTPTDTTEPATNDTVDTSAPDTVDTSNTEPVPDTTEPEENIFFENEKYTVTVTDDGRYCYYCESKGITRIYEDAFTLDGELYLVDVGNGVCTLYAPNEHGQLKSRMNAASFTKYGEFVWADGKLYDWQLVNIYSPSVPWYIDGTYTVTGIDYDESAGELHILADLEGKELLYTFYSALDTDTPIPGAAELLGEITTYSGGEMALYRTNDAYYCTYDHLSLKLPVEGEFDDVSLLRDNMVRFVRTVGGELEVIDFHFLFKQTARDEYFIAGSTTEAKLGKAEEFNNGYTENFEYNGATVINVDPMAYVIKDGEIALAIESYRFNPRTIGDYLVIGDDYYEPNTIVKPDLTLLSDKQFDMVRELTAGNIFASYTDGGAVVFDTNGEIAYELDSSLEVMLIGVNRRYNDDGTSTVLGEWALVKWKEDGTMRLLTPYGNELCNFGTVDENWRFHSMLSGGYYEKEGYPSGVYFIFEDPTDTDEYYGYRSWEYYYSFETGESGLIDGGYSSFAYAKPVLYLYPTEETDVTVTFEHPERLTVDYPKYTDGWRVTAMPDGTLTGENGREYYALYWEEDSASAYYAFPDGFCVSGEDSAAFLEEKLAALGFTDKEANEFIIYWLPILEASEYNLIRFELTEEREASNALHISPTPDSLLRVAMHVKAIDAPVTIREQRLPSFERVGFVAVEWGGCIH